MPKATATGLDANERFFDAVFESHQFFSFISFKSKVINDNRWTKNYDQGSICISDMGGKRTKDELYKSELEGITRPDTL